jgi:hypothetical protein
MSRSRRFPIPAQWILRIGQQHHWRCHICELGYKPNERWVIDHDKSLAKGGTNYLSNLRLAHSGCNNEKSDA